VWNGFLPLTTYLLTAYKDDKLVYVCAHPWQNPYIDEPIVKSLQFQ
jgi:hypothetical protein